MLTEFDFINQILEHRLDSDSVIVPNGDDAAVISVGDRLLAISVDSMIEGTHFTFNFSTPYQVGVKAIESTISDIAAMGGAPQFVLISITIPKNGTLESGVEIYKGIRESCSSRHVLVLGGDTSRGGNSLSISITALGEIQTEAHICRRSDAQVGDLIFISGPLGGSAAGLYALQRNLDGYEAVKKKHQEPRCRADLSALIGGVANAVIDISDGLSSELHHICKASAVGCIIDEDKIPLCSGVSELAQHIGVNPFDLAWNGGEDYELLFTVSPTDRAKAPGVQIGEITADRDLIFIRNGQRQEIISRGFDHFADGASTT